MSIDKLARSLTTQLRQTVLTRVQRGDRGYGMYRGRRRRRSLDDLDDLGASVFVPLVIRFARRRIHQAQLQALLEISAVDPAHDLQQSRGVDRVEINDVV